MGSPKKLTEVVASEKASLIKRADPLDKSEIESLQDAKSKLKSDIRSQQSSQF